MHYKVKVIYPFRDCMLYRPHIGLLFNPLLASFCVVYHFCYMPDFSASEYSVWKVVIYLIK